MKPEPVLCPDRFESLREKSLLVTGAAGFIGGALLRRLASYGFNVTGTVLLPHEAEDLRAQGFQAEILDLTHDDSWDHLLQDVDIVFHLAAQFQEYESDEHTYDKANHLGALKLTETAERVGVERFVHCSTVGVHGHVKEIPATEGTPFNPMDVYHRTKLSGELAIVEFAQKLRADQMSVTVNRPAMVYGPGDLRMLKLFQAILQQKFFMIGSGEVLAHLGYIDDQVDSLLLSAVAPREDVHAEAFNIASDRPCTLNELARTIADYGAVGLPKWHVPVKPVWFAAWLCEWACKPLGLRPPLFRRRVGFFTHDRAFDLSKARVKLGYESRWSLAKGVAATIDWYRDHDYIDR